MTGNWARVAPSALTDLDRSRLGERTSTDKNWAGFDYLLRRQGFPVDIVFGEETFPGAAPADWGYGPPTYLTPAQVTRAAAALATLTEADLIHGVTPAEATAADLYSFYPSTTEDLLDVAAELPPAQRFFAAAAAAGDAVVCWLS